MHILAFAFIHGLGSGKGEVAVHAYRGKAVCRCEVCCLSLV